MRKYLCAVSLFAAAIAPAGAANICIATRNVMDTQPQGDGKAIFFRLYDGSTWRNDLKGNCPDLRFHGFVWSVQNPDGSVCENTQSLRVLDSGQVCVLGKFTQVIAPKKSN